MKKVCFILLLLVCQSVSAQQELWTPHFKIYDTRQQKPATIEDIVAAMNDADVLFFGEEHNDSAAHYLEAYLLGQLHFAFSSKLALSLEMFESDNQLVLNEYLQGRIDESRLAKDARLWSNYRDYRPMIEFAKNYKVPVIAANPPRRYVTLVGRRGMQALDSLSPEAKKFLPPLPYDTLSGRYREKFFEIMKGSPGGENPRVYYSQCLWDAGMSDRIYQYWRKNRRHKVFHCVGKFHSDEKLGTAAQLQLRSKKIRILNISCFSDRSFSNPDWSKFLSLGDFVILTNPDLKRTY